MKKSGIIIGLVTGIAMLFSFGSTVVAADETDTVTAQQVTVQEEKYYQGIIGTIGIDSNITGGILVVEMKSLGNVEVVLSDNTTYQAPGQDEVTKDDLKIGQRIAVLAEVGDDTAYTAVRVMLIPGTPTRRHVSGVVVSVENGLMTIVNAAGDSMTIELPAGVKGGVVGDFISAAVRQSGGKHVASGACTAEEMQTRLRTHLNALADFEAGNVTGNQTRDQLMNRLGDEIEGLCLRNKSELNKVMAKAPESAKAAMKAAIGDCEERLEQARLQIREAQNRAGFGQSNQSKTSGSGNGRR